MPPVSMSPEQIAQWFPQMDEFTRQVLEGYYLGEGNPYTQDLISAIEGDARRNYETSVVPLQRSNLALSGAYGSALGTLAQGRTAEEFNRSLMGQIAGTRTGLYESERDRMASALQGFQGQTSAARGDLAGMRNVDETTAAQRFAASQAAGAARFGASQAAGASRYATTTNARLQALRDLMQYSQQQNYYNTFGGGGFQSPIQTNYSTTTPSEYYNKFAFGGPEQVGGTFQ